MVKLLWAVAWTVVAVWSLFALAGYGLVDLFGGVLARNADMLSDNPETVETLFNLLSGVRSFGLGAILTVWGAVCLAILSVPWLMGRLARAPADLGLRRAAGPAGALGPGRAAEPGVIDLPPDQYASDRPNEAPRPPSGAGGSVPRVGRG